VKVGSGTRPSAGLGNIGGPSSEGKGNHFKGTSMCAGRTAIIAYPVLRWSMHYGHTQYLMTLGKDWDNANTEKGTAECRLRRQGRPFRVRVALDLNATRITTTRSEGVNRYEFHEASPPAAT